MLAISDGLEFIGAPRWQLVLILLMCWSIVAICLSKGIRSFGKVRITNGTNKITILTAHRMMSPFVEFIFETLFSIE